MWKIWILTFPLVVSIGCRKGEQPLESPTTPGQNEQQPGGMWEEFGGEGGTQPSQPGTPSGEGMGPVGQAPTQPQPTNPAVGELALNIESIRGAEQLANDDAATALRNVATGLEQMAGAEGAAENIARIRSLADQIQASDPTSPEQSSLARAAMEESMTALQNLATSRGIQDFDPQVQNMRMRMEALQANQPLATQGAAFADSLQQIADSITMIEQRPATGTQ
jgi:hypothetical protein